jgi:hypothetical protein
LFFEDELLQSKLYEQLKKVIRTTLEYLAKCYVNDETIYVYCGSIGEDEQFWGRPEDYEGTHPCVKIPVGGSGTNLKAVLISAFAAGANFFLGWDSDFSDFLLDKATRLYSLMRSDSSKDDIFDLLPELKLFYSKKNQIEADVYEAGLWMDMANGSLHNIDHYMYEYIDFHLDNISTDYLELTKIRIHYLIYKMKNDVNYFEVIENYLDTIIQKPTSPGGFSIPFPNESILYFNPVIELSFWALLIAKEPFASSPQTFNNWALNQINYILGDNPLSISYMIGHSKNFIFRGRHKGSSCKSAPSLCLSEAETAPGVNPNPVLGAVIRGIENDFVLNDSRQNELNSVRILENAPFPGVLARIHLLYGKEEQKDTSLFPRTGQCALGPEEYPGKHVSNISLYELYLAKEIDSPFPLKNTGSFLL